MSRSIAAVSSLAHAAMAFAVAFFVTVCLSLSPVAAQSSDAPSDGYTPAMVELKARPTVALGGTADWDEGMKAIVEAIDKLRRQMNDAGLEAAGAPLAVFVETDDKGFRYEAMIPLAARPETTPNLPNGTRIAASPTGRTMKFEHRGSYDEIDTTYEAITAYLDEKGLEAQNLFVEEYLNLPRTPEEDGAQVDIYVFLK